MKLRHCAGFLVITYLFALNGISKADQDCSTPPTNIEEQCATYSYKALAPLLGYVKELNQQLANNNQAALTKEITELKMQLNTLNERLVGKDQLIALYISNAAKMDETHAHIKTQLKASDEFCRKTIERLTNYSISSNSVKFEREVAANTNIIDKLYSQQAKLQTLIDTNALKSLHYENNQSEQIITIEKYAMELKNKTDDMLITQDRLQKCERALNSKFVDTCAIQLNECKEKNIPDSCIPFGDTPGVHSIKPYGKIAFKVLCDSIIPNEGWTVIQQRINGEEDFYRNWTAYRNGFGSLDGDFFLGLEKIHQLTYSQRHELYIFMEHFDGGRTYDRYDYFRISNEHDDYRLEELGKKIGNALGSEMRFHLNMKFSTFDRDNDVWSEGNCAKKHNGGWWYTKCGDCNLNGKYFKAKVNNETSIFWEKNTSLKTVKMLIRPKTG